MAVQLDQNGKDDLKTQFVTREGTYRLMTLSEYSRPNRVGYQTNQNNPQVRVSLVSLPTNNYQSTASGGTGNCGGLQQQPQQNSSTSSSLGAPSSSINGQTDGLEPSTVGGGDRICFNFGKELYVYAYRGCKKLTADLNKPIDKKLYKGTNPSCHDFNEATALSDGAPLLVGFTTGQIQLVQPGKREPGRLFNEERFIDKTKVTCLKWLPKSPNLFLASHSSGFLYLYNEELPCTPAAPNYQPFKSGDGYTILTCKSKTTRNPLYKWTFSTEINCSINEFCFSPCGQFLAIVSQDGFLRVFNYDKMELVGVARSYFGGFLCVCWSPDGKYIVVGGEDDLVTVWSVNERRVVARGQGHRSWVSVVAFDPYTSYSNWDGPDFSDDEATIINDGYICYNNDNHNDVTYESNQTIGNGGGGKRPTSSSFRDSTCMPEKLGTSYRLGSVSQDTHFCLWDITEDLLRQSYEIRHRLSSYDPQVNGELITGVESHKQPPSSDLAKSTVIAIGNPTVASCSGVGAKDSVDGSNSSSKNSSNSSSKSGSKFATANCTSGSESGRSSLNELNSKHLNNTNKLLSSNSGKSSQLIKENNTSASTAAAASTTTTPSDTNNKSSSSSTKTNSESGLTAFNSITQRFSNFSFGSDKKSSSSSTATTDGGGGGGGSGSGSGHNHKKTFTFSKSTGNHTGFLHINNINSNTDACGSGSGSSGCGTSGIKNSKSTAGGVVPSYDPMKLIGTSVCPRYDECPLLEPLVCKKIAHERLTALIFREDCFLTACQDGFIYTWARPGYSNIPQHISASPTAPPGGTVV